MKYSVEEIGRPTSCKMYDPCWGGVNLHLTDIIGARDGDGDEQKSF